MKTNHHFSQSVEDYLEAIYMLGGQNVRSVDIANRLVVSRASVNRAVNALMEKKMVSKMPYGAVSLTEYGLEISKKVENKHRILKRFLMEMLGVDEERANEEACGIEHDISDDTAKRIAALMRDKP